MSGTQTMFLGTSHPTRGVDSSHRGGGRSFVHVEGQQLWWPDFPGNNMFTSIGNLVVDTTAALLFVDFTSGASLHLSGVAGPDWSPKPSPDVSDQIEHAVRFTPTRIREVP